MSTRYFHELSPHESLDTQTILRNTHKTYIDKKVLNAYFLYESVSDFFSQIDSYTQYNEKICDFPGHEIHILHGCLL